MLPFNDGCRGEPPTVTENKDCKQVAYPTRLCGCVVALHTQIKNRGFFRPPNLAASATSKTLLD